jgi:SagB-type dehydrogenase family enzyme
MPAEKGERVALPAPVMKGPRALEETLSARRSVREFKADPLSPQEISQLLWAAQGITHAEGLRTAPSAGALYPLELFAATAEGFSRYEPHGHGLVVLSARDVRRAIHKAGLLQEFLLEAPLVVVIAAVYERLERKYGRVWSRIYAHMEAGHAAQNVHLQAVSLGLGSVPVGAFHAGQLRRALKLPEEEKPVYLIAVGRPRAA